MEFRGFHLTPARVRGVGKSGYVGYIEEERMGEVGRAVPTSYPGTSA